MQKNDLLRLSIDDLAADCEGVGKVDGMTVFVPGALPGESVTARCVKLTKHLAYAKLLSVETASSDRQTPPCPHFSTCGGCACQHMTYERSLLFKRDQVRACLARIGGIQMDVPPALKMDTPFYYRNKTALPVGGERGNPQVGFFAPRSHRITPIDACMAARHGSDEAARGVLSWMKAFHIAPYDEGARTGLVRHIVTRVTRAGEAMVTLCVNADAIPHERELVDTLREAVPGLASVCLSPNTSAGNVILGDCFRVLWGRERLSETLCGLTFSLSPMSFFQINPDQTEALYQTALDFAGLRENDLALDLYCGAGTITLLAAQRAERVIGIESVREAVADARANAERNGVTNAEFLCGRAEALLPELIADGLRPDAVLLDPPRKGADEKVLRAISDAKPARVCYISCDPATQARDARILCALGYCAEKCQPVDMFCWTSKVENVLLFERKELP